MLLKVQFVLGSAKTKQGEATNTPQVRTTAWQHNVKGTWKPQASRGIPDFVKGIWLMFGKRVVPSRCLVTKTDKSIVWKLYLCGSIMPAKLWQNIYEEICVASTDYVRLFVPNWKLRVINKSLWSHCYVFIGTEEKSA